MPEEGRITGCSRLYAYWEDEEEEEDAEKEEEKKERKKRARERERQKLALAQLENTFENVTWFLYD